MFAALFSHSFSLNYYWHFVVIIIILCLASSANYTINEWLDRDSDKNHPTKFTRPAALGFIEGKYVLIQYIVLSTLSLIFSSIINIKFLFLTFTFLLLGISYNVKPLRTKDRIILDVISESANNPVRFLFGWYVVSPNFPPSSALFGYWASGAFLMTLKRYGEKKQFSGNNEMTQSQLAKYRISLSIYTQQQLFSMALFFAILSASFFGIFLSKYSPLMVMAIPSTAMTFVEYFRLSELPDSPAQHPELLYKERKLLLWASSVILLCFIAIGFER